MESFVTLSNLIIATGFILLIVYWIHAFILLYHFIRFGIGPHPKQAALIFFFGSIVLFIFLGITTLPIAFLI